MWCNQHHEKVQSYHVAKSHRHISLYWNLKKWIQKFSLKQNTLNDIKQFVKRIKLHLESCPSSTMDIHHKNVFLTQLTNELSPNERLPFHFEAPKRVDLIGSFLFYGICFNPKYSHTDHFNVDISVTMPSPTCITLKDITTNSKYYLLKRRVYLDTLYKHLTTKKLKMISPNHNKLCQVSIHYLNHDPSKPILVIKATPNCYIRIIPSLDIKQFTINSETDEMNATLESDDEDDDDDDEGEDLDENMVMERVFFGSFYKQFRVLKEQYGTDLNDWSHSKLSEHLHPENASKQQLVEHYLCGQQIMEDMFMRSTFFDFYAACKENPNLHRALVLIKAWWNKCNFHAQKAAQTSTDSTRFGDMNSFHLTQLLLLFHRSYHFDKWDSPLVVMAKFLELVSREEIGTLLCQTPPCSLFERNPNWYTSFGDSHLFTSLTSNMDNNRDRSSIFDPKQIDHKQKDSNANANIYNTDNEDGDAVSNVHYSYNIWKTKKKGVSMSMPNDAGNGLLNQWIDNNESNQLYLKLLSSDLFPVVFSNVSGKMNYCFRVNRCNYLHFIKEARKASIALNSLLMEIPFMPNPEFWSYPRAIDPTHYDIVKAAVMTYHQKCIHQLLISNKLDLVMYFDGFIKLNIKSLLSDSSSIICILNRLEDILLNALSDRCRTILFDYDPQEAPHDLYVGLTMHTFCFREMILGPPKHEKLAGETFAEFWGKTCVENKRFPDGTLLHTVTLSDSHYFEDYLTIIDKAAKESHVNKQKLRSIEIKNSANPSRNKKKGDSHSTKLFKRPSYYMISVILYHILHKHSQLNPCDIRLTLDPFWSITSSHLAHAKQIGDKTDIMRLDRAYEKLSQVLKSVCSNKQKHGVPLRLNNIVSIDAHLWNAAISTPKQKNMHYSSYSLIDSMQAIQVGLKFQTTDFWPKSSPQALNSLKLAFYIQMHRGLQKYRIHSLLSKRYIDVVVNGFTFRCSIIADTEFVVHKFDSARIARYRYKFLPKLGHVLQGISRNYAYFSPTISLVKRWFHCNLFSDLINEHLISVLVADLFVNSEPYQAPQSTFIAFVRFLYLLANFNWIETPYIVDLGLFDRNMLSKSLSTAPTSYQYRVFKSKMLNARMNDRGFHAMYVVVPGMEDSSQWTRSKPTLKTLDRLVTSARVSLKYLVDQQQDKANDDAFLRVFKPSKNEFDFIVNLKTSTIPKYGEYMWKTERGMNEWRAEQILKRMSKLTMQQQKQVTAAAEAEKKRSKNVDADGAKKRTAPKLDGFMPFVANPIWEQKKRKMEEIYEDEDGVGPATKKRKLNTHLEKLIEENPAKFLEENELFVIGVNPVHSFLSEITKFTGSQIEIYYDKYGADFIGCKWLIEANNVTQKTVYSAIWELGQNIVKSIKVNRCPSKKDIDEIQEKQQIKEMFNVMHVGDQMPQVQKKKADDGWTVVDSKHNV